MRQALGFLVALVLAGMVGAAAAQTGPAAPRAPARATPSPPGIAPPTGSIEATADGTCRIWVPLGLTGTASWNGACRNRLAEGAGTATWPTPQGSIAITGTFRAGILTGPGTRTNPDDGRFEGQFVQTVPQGEGAYVAPNGMRYEGPFVNGGPSGTGRVSFPNGDRYVGGVLNGRGEGEGVYTWANGDRYEGTQRDGYPDGQGRFISGAQVFEGTWTRGCFFGAGGTRIAVVRPMAECR